SETPRVADARIEQAEFVVDAYKREQVLLRRWNDLSKTRCDLGLVVIPDLMERTPTVVGVRSHFEHVAAQRRTRGNRIAANRAIARLKQRHCLGFEVQLVEPALPSLWLVDASHDEADPNVHQ